MPGEIIYAIAGIITYLAGAIPFGWIFVKWIKKQDLRTLGSRNIGATNAARVLGRIWFFPIFSLDFMKGFAPVFWLAPWVATHKPCPHCPYLDVMMSLFCALMALGGHLFPIYLGFKGGKAVATGAGVLFAVNWIAGLVALGTFLIVFVLLRYVSVGSMLGALSMPFTQFWTGARFYKLPEERSIMLGFLVVLALAIVVKHRENLRRLMKGEENRVTFRKAKNG